MNPTRGRFYFGRWNQQSGSVEQDFRRPVDATLKPTRGRKTRCSGGSDNV